MDIKNRLIILVGISGSSKTTWSTDYIKDNFNFLRINRDDIRRTLVGSLESYYQRKDLKIIEEQINFIELYLSGTFYDDNYNIIIDNTNLKYSYLNKWLLWVNNHKEYEVQFKLFDISLEEAKERVLCRDCRLVDSVTISKNLEWDQKKLEYIDKQFEQYKQIKQYLETNYKDQII